jgi:hypothetical protein
MREREKEKERERERERECVGGRESAITTSTRHEHASTSDTT